MTAAQLLRSAREASGITQTELSRRARTSQPDISVLERGSRVPTADTLERLLGLLGHVVVAIPSVGPDAVATAERIRLALHRNSDDAALRALIDYSDALGGENGANRIGLSLARPARTGQPVWDAALAGVVDFHLADRYPKPAWIDDPDRYLVDAIELIAIPNAPAIHRGDVPPEFLTRNVLVERGTFASV